MAGPRESLAADCIMSSLSELTQHFARLKEISGIMTAMKSLSLVETRKLARFIEHQRRMLGNIEAAAADFLSFHPIEQTSAPSPTILLLIGSERGFCGNFNDRIVAALATLPHEAPEPLLVVLGHRLQAKLEDHPKVIARIDGPTVTEDVPTVLNRLMDALHTTTAQLASDGATLACLAHDAEGEPVLKHVLPMAPPAALPYTHPPRLQLAPPAFFAGLLDQYLLAALYGQLYASLAAENHQRLAHMEHALDRLDEILAHLMTKRNALRQEKIVEEIEVILSSELALQPGAR
jgi:F-type H+-transporting ATPase subunit gamma